MESGRKLNWGSICKRSVSYTAGHWFCWGSFWSLPELNSATDRCTRKHTCSHTRIQKAQWYIKGPTVSPIHSPTVSEKQADNWDIWNHLLIYSPALISFHIRQWICDWYKWAFLKATPMSECEYLQCVLLHAELLSAELGYITSNGRLWASD